MQTFLILLAIIFVPFVWFIRRMLRFTNETVCDDSLVFGLDTSPNRTRTYQFSEADYFGTFDKALYAFTFLMMLIVAYVILQVPPQLGILARLTLLLALLSVLAFAGYIAYFFYIDWKFWTITRHVSVTFDPYTPSITIDGPQDFAVFTPGTLSHIDQHILKIDNYKHPLFGYGCFCMHRTDGQFVWVNAAFFNGFSARSFLERFFPPVPVTTVHHKFPYVSIIEQFGNGPSAEL